MQCQGKRHAGKRPDKNLCFHDQLIFLLTETRKWSLKHLHKWPNLWRSAPTRNQSEKTMWAFFSFVLLSSFSSSPFLYIPFLIFSLLSLSLFFSIFNFKKVWRSESSEMTYRKLEENNLKYLIKLSFRNKGKIKIFSHKLELKEFVLRRLGQHNHSF